MAIYKEFCMSWPDFIGELMAYWGARLDIAGAWRLPNGMGVSLRPQPLNPCVEEGWYRWQLPSCVDGVTRGRLIDRNAPFVVRSPNGRWFWCSPRGGYMIRVGVWQLLDKVAEHAIDSRGRRGWPLAGAVRAEGGAA